MKRREFLSAFRVRTSSRPIKRCIYDIVAGAVGGQAQPNSFRAIPECHIFVMWPILSPLNCMM
jgi:hypothetical protein